MVDNLAISVRRATPEDAPALADLVNDAYAIEKSFVDDLDVDSLSMVEIIYACEETFGVSIPDEDAKTLQTIGDAVNYIERAQA